MSLHAIVASLTRYRKAQVLLLGNYSWIAVVVYLSTFPADADNSLTPLLTELVRSSQ